MVRKLNLGERASQLGIDLLAVGAAVAVVHCLRSGHTLVLLLLLVEAAPCFSGSRTMTRMMRLVTLLLHMLTITTILGVTRLCMLTTIPILGAVGVCGCSSTTPRVCVLRALVCVTIVLLLRVRQRERQLAHRSLPVLLLTEYGCPRIAPCALLLRRLLLLLLWLWLPQLPLAVLHRTGGVAVRLLRRVNIWRFVRSYIIAIAAVWMAAYFASVFVGSNNSNWKTPGWQCLAGWHIRKLQV